MEEIRKLQITGGSTYIISLPKKWVKQLGLKPGDSVFLSIRKDGKIVISARKEKEVHAEGSMTVKQGTGLDRVAREFVALYLVGYDTIYVKFQPGTMEQRSFLKKFIKQKIIGMELIEEGRDYIVVQSFVKHAEIPIPRAIERMGVMVSFMLDDAVEALLKGDKNLARAVIERDNDVDRFYLFIVRELKAAMNSLQLLEKIGLTTVRDCLGYRLVAKSIERAGDHAERIARIALSLEAGVGDFFGEDFMEMKKLSGSIFDDALRALQSLDAELAHEVLDRTSEVYSLERRLVKRLIDSKDVERALELRLVIESVRRFAEYGGDIAEIAINLATKPPE